VVQIHPPQPISSSTYGRFTSSALSISPNHRRSGVLKGDSLPADPAKIRQAPAGLQVSTSAHRDQLCLARAISALSGMDFSARSTAFRGADKVDSVDHTSAQVKQGLLTETESAKRVGVSLSTFRRWCRKGIGPRFFLLGGILRYRIVDLDEFVASHVRRGGA
jgi:predicted DNA-binding transcriptional regulator AlpA